MAGGTGDVAPDMGTVEALCVLQLVARRLGCSIRVYEASAELRELILLAGLDELLLDVPGRRSNRSRRVRGGEGPADSGDAR